MFLELPSPELQTQLLKHFNENPETRGRDVKIIKDWLLEQPHLPNAWRNEDKRILTFLRTSKFSIEACKKRLDTYFTVRSSFPEFFANRDVTRPNLQEIFRIGDAAVLPKLTPEGKRVTIARAAIPDFDTPNLADIAKLAFMAGDIRLEWEEFGVFTDVYIIDLNFPLAKHFLNVSLFVVRNFLHCIQEAYPVEISELHFINAPPFLETMVNVISPFLSTDLQNSIKIHTGVETLYDFVPKDILPEDYGGEGAKLVEYKNQWVKTLEEYSSWFKSQEDVKSDESKRQRKAFSFYSLFGFDNGFRELNID